MIRDIDYHIHYYVDGCSNENMTLENIETEAVKLGLKEVAVLKHYSEELPNKEEKWVNWKKVKIEEFNAYLEDIYEFRNKSQITIFSGVETELINDQGKINIPKEAQDKIDLVQLSVHWLPDMKVLPFDANVFPGKKAADGPPEALANWKNKINNTSKEAILENFIEANIQAIKQNPKVKVLAHMGDGLNPLRAFHIPIDELGEETILKYMEPLMHTCTAHNVLWELHHQIPVQGEYILQHGRKLGVNFIATRDTHSIDKLREREQVEDYIDTLALERGKITI